MQETGYHAMSVSALSERAEVSVGLIYQYFGGKEDVLQALIVDILEDFAAQIPAQIEAAGPDPVDRLTSAVHASCRIIDLKQEAAVLAYRESQTLDKEGRRKIMALELETSEPIRAAIRDGIASGVFRKVDVDLAAHNVLMIAHSWALKHWNLASRMTVQQYAEAQTDLVLAALRPA
ncbi:MAG: TetR/AcrR family transcriptional regulator [Dermatophilus congolensis]|nr:TetR/AcrR family transcriptional regulator [Dermatophilus congolensis]